MAVTDGQVEMLRAYLVGDDAEYGRLGQGPNPPDRQPDFNALVAAAFVEAVNQYFGKDHRITGHRPLRRSHQNPTS
jgi:hypothetical protein